MKLRKVLALLFVIAMMFTLAACSTTSKFVGHWVEVDGGGPYDSFILRKDGSASVDDGFPGEWRVTDGKFYIGDAWDGGDEYYYDISGNTLKLAEVDDPDDYATYEKIN